MEWQKTAQYSDLLIAHLIMLQSFDEIGKVGAWQSDSYGNKVWP